MGTSCKCDMHRFTTATVKSYSRIVKHILGVLLNIALLLYVVPTVTAWLVGWFFLHERGFAWDAALFGAGGYITALVIWHILVWETRIKIRRRWLLFVVRTIKAAWIPLSFIAVIASSMGELSPTVYAYAVSAIVVSAAYASLRHLFAPRYRI